MVTTHTLQRPNLSNFPKLPSEVQFMVLQNLDFADLCRVRATCSYFRSFFSENQIAITLIRFESTLVDASRLAPSFPTAVDLASFCRHRELPVKTFRRLLDWPERSECELRVLPCYGCLRIKMISEFDPFQLCTFLLSRETPEKMRRRCIDCIFSSKAALQDGTPWLALSDGRAMLRCRRCKKIDIRESFCVDFPSELPGMTNDKLCRTCRH